MSKIRLLRSFVTSIFLYAVNHGPSQQSCKEEYEPWKLGATENTTNLIQKPCYQRGSRVKIQQSIGPHEDLTIL